MSKIRVYKYGILPPIENGNIVYEQMFRAHRYRNTLTEIERGRRVAVRSITRENDDNIKQIETNFLALQELENKISKEIKSQHSLMRSRISTQTDKEELKAVREKKKDCKKLLFDARKAAKNNPIIVLGLEQIKLREKDLIHGARELCGCYSGTYLLVEDAMNASRKMPLYDGLKDNDPRFISWRNEGEIGVNLQNQHKKKEINQGLDPKEGISVKEVFSNDTRIHIDPVDEKAFYAEDRKDRRKYSRTILHLRVKSDDKRGPIWASFPMIMHRPLPENGRIKNASVNIKRIGSREEWSLIMTVDMSDVLPATYLAQGAVAIDLGWRDMKDSNGNTTHFRLGKWRGQDNEMGEIKISSSIISGLRKASELKGIRDDNFNSIRSLLIDWLKNNSSPIWMQEKTKTLFQWKSIDRLVKLIKYWEINRFDGDENIVGVIGKWNKETKSLLDGTGLLGWVYNDFHLWTWECNQRTKAIRGRKEIYRIFAAQLASKYKYLILEDFDLRKVSKDPEPDDNDDNQKGRSNKTLAAPSELRLALINAFDSRRGQIVEVDPAGTSYTCHLCKSKEHLDHSTYMHTCGKCDKTWDRDDNAAANILERGCERLSDMKSAVVARIGENDSENKEVQETRYQRRSRAKQEKVVSKAGAREAEDKAA